MGLSFTTAPGLRQWSHSWVRAPRDSCLRFETSPTRRAGSSYLHPPTIPRATTFLSLYTIWYDTNRTYNTAVKYLEQVWTVRQLLKLISADQDRYGPKLSGKLWIWLPTGRQSLWWFLWSNITETERRLTMFPVESSSTFQHVRRI
jgi:hypothetical protein